MKHLLNEGEAFCILPGRNGLILKCVKGTLWVTKKGDPSDYILTDGECIILEARNKIALQAFSGTTIDCEGQNMNLHEIKVLLNKIVNNKISIKQTHSPGYTTCSC